MRMRTFDQFVARRQIDNLESWVTAMGFTSDEQIAQWCLNEEIEPPKRKFFDTEESQSEAIQEIETTKNVAKPTIKKKHPSAKDPTWVPAAERSRKVRGKKPAIKKQKKAGEEDEKSSGSIKKSNTK